MTPCHENGRGCIRAFEDDTCGEQGQCSIVLAILAERERCAKVADDMYEKWRKLDAHAGLSARVIRDAIRKDPK